MRPLRPAAWAKKPHVPMSRTECEDSMPNSLTLDFGGLDHEVESHVLRIERAESRIEISSPW